MNWIVVDIGCLECWIDSHIVGVFTSKDRAGALAKKLDHETGTDQDFVVFPMPEFDVVAPEYKE